MEEKERDEKATEKERDLGLPRTLCSFGKVPHQRNGNDPVAKKAYDNVICWRPPNREFRKSGHTCYHTHSTNAAGSDSFVSFALSCELSRQL